MTPPYPSLQSRLPPEDERLGMAWWNAMSRDDRRYALASAEARFGRHASPADAWIAWKYATGQIDSPSGRGVAPRPAAHPAHFPLTPAAPQGSGAPPAARRVPCGAPLPLVAASPVLAPPSP